MVRLVEAECLVLFSFGLREARPICFPVVLKTQWCSLGTETVQFRMGSTMGSKSFHPSGYRSWRQIAGYFDGDGSILLKPKMYTISFSIEWADTSLPQLEQIRDFLMRHGILSQPKIQKMVGECASYSLMVSYQDSVLGLAKSMSPFAFKKWAGLHAAIRYLEDETTGNELVAASNKTVTDGTRAGKILEISMPHTRSESLVTARKLGASKAGLSRRKLTTQQVLEVKGRHGEKGESIRKLAFAYSVFESVILRALHV